MASNPDVAAAVRDGNFPSGYAHAVLLGLNEGREFPVADITLSELRADVQQLQRELEISRTCANFRDVAQKIAKQPIIIFYTPRFLEGNLKYVFFETVRLIRSGDLDAKCYFLCLQPEVHRQLTEAGYPSLLWQLNGAPILGLLLRTAVVVDDAFFVNGPPTPPLLHAMLHAARRVNLWHGTPLRKILLQKLDLNRDITHAYSVILKAAVDNNVFCGTSANDKVLFEEAMCIEEFAVTGYARNDVFYRELSKDDLLNVDTVLLERLRQRPAGSKIAFYAPTWREGNPDWILTIALPQLAESLAKQGIRLLVNLHPFEMSRHMSFLQTIDGLDVVSPHTDVYPVMKEVDLLITDYSSIAFDYLHLLRPVVFFRPDHDAYLNKNRALIPDRLDALDMPIAYDAEQCAKAVVEVLTNKEPLRQQLEKSLARSHDFRDGLSATRCAKAIARAVVAVCPSSDSVPTRTLDQG
ncbi:CDP-glycerol glycerophosphotransferase family protein [Paraburkholderia sp.]|uniref:CDP-glycerol glycerophosphotransferase family protein n=1 Tax=Paraburkholderia sp. TaxID=1926495 RepID=UPI00286F7F86|nr:CDP-glycerol glycerophosphotransferase family protein [Paraburkholderia sp.]